MRNILTIGLFVLFSALCGLQVPSALAGQSTIEKAAILQNAVINRDVLITEHAERFGMETDFEYGSSGDNLKYYTALLIARALEDTCLEKVLLYAKDEGVTVVPDSYFDFVGPGRIRVNTKLSTDNQEIITYLLGDSLNLICFSFVSPTE